MHTLLCGLEACLLRKANVNSLDFVVNRFFHEAAQNKQAMWHVVRPPKCATAPASGSAGLWGRQARALGLARAGASR